MSDSDIAQIIAVLRDVLLTHMQEGLPDYCVQTAVYGGKNTGVLLSTDDISIGKDIPNSLQLTMQNGKEYRLYLKEEE